MVWQAVFFDFDGVILDSVHVKTAAFAGMFRCYGPEMEKRIVNYHLATGGVSRFEKFRHIHHEILGKPLSEGEAARLGERFSALVLSGVLDSPCIAGALDALKALQYTGIPAFVASGTPHDELKHIVARRSLSRYFREVHGSPRRKPEMVRDLSLRYDLDPAACLFVGDAMTDYNAASASGTRFFGIVAEGEPSPFPAETPVSWNVADFLSHELSSPTRRIFTFFVKQIRFRPALGIFTLLLTTFGALR